MHTEIKYNVALILTGEIRTLDKTQKLIFDKIINPLKADVFIHSSKTNYKDNVNIDNNIFNKYWGDNVKKYKFMPGKNVDINSPDITIDDINELNEYEKLSNIIWLYKKGCGEQVFKRCGVNRNYLLNSGTLIEYYQILKASQMMYQYEKDNNVKYDFIIRSRLDVILTNTPNLHNIPINTIHTHRKNMVWIMRRSSALSILPLIYFYGDYDNGSPYTWDSESQFSLHLDHHGIKQIDHWNDEEERTLTTRSLNLNTLIDNKINPNLSSNIRMFVVRPESYSYFSK